MTTGRVRPVSLTVSELSGASTEAAGLACGFQWKQGWAKGGAAELWNPCAVIWC